jgi:hypothetical protein
VFAVLDFVLGCQSSEVPKEKPAEVPKENHAEFDPKDYAETRNWLIRLDLANRDALQKVADTNNSLLFKNENERLTRQFMKDISVAVGKHVTWQFKVKEVDEKVVHLDAFCMFCPGSKAVKVIREYGDPYYVHYKGELGYEIIDKNKAATLKTGDLVTIEADVVDVANDAAIYSPPVLYFRNHDFPNGCDICSHDWYLLLVNVRVKD